MNCPRCNYPINKNYVWSNCPKCNCRLNLDTAPTQNVNVSQQYPNTTSDYYQSNSATYRNVSPQSHPKISYCMHCGQKIDDGQKYCFQCGSAIFNHNRANHHLQTHKKFINKKAVYSICGSLILILLIIIIVIASNNTLSNKLIGDWTTDRGMDSEYVKFKSNGKMIYGDFIDSHSSSWKLDGETLVISDYYNKDSYIYTPAAKQSSDRYTWYIEGNTLYYNNRIYYKEKSTDP